MNQKDELKPSIGQPEEEMREAFAHNTAKLTLEAPAPLWMWAKLTAQHSPKAPARERERVLLEA